MENGALRLREHPKEMAAKLLGSQWTAYESGRRARGATIMGWGYLERLRGEADARSEADVR